MASRIDESTLQSAISSSNLAKLDCYLPVSWMNLTALRGLIPHPMQLENLCFYGDLRVRAGGPQKVSSEFVSSLQETVSMLHPVELKETSNDYHTTWFLLQTLKLDRLKILHIKDGSYGKSHLRGCVDIKPVMSVIEASKLSHLIVNIGNLNQFTHLLLEHISSAKLEYLNATIRKRSTEKESQGSGLLPREGDCSPLDFHVRQICKILRPSSMGTVSSPIFRAPRFKWKSKSSKMLLAHPKCR